MRRASAAAALLCAVLASPGWAAAAAPAAEGAYRFPRHAQPADIEIQCASLLQDLKARQARLASGEAGANGLLIHMDRVTRAVEDTLGPLSLVANVHPVKPLRDAAEACELRYQAFASQFFQDARIHRRLLALPTRDAIDAQYRRDLLDAFEDSGVALAPAKRERARALNNEISKLTQTFDRRVRETATKVAFTEAELEGVPGAVWSKAPRDAQGRVLLGLDYPSYNPVMEHARDPAARERMWRAFQSRGGEPNLGVLAQLGAKRREYARLFGLDSYADFAVRRRMARSVERVQGFLAEVQAVTAARERRDLDDLRVAKSAELREPLEQVQIKRWDTAYYGERVKRDRYALDQESFRRHFPAQASVDMVMALAGRLFGVAFQPLDQPLWHPDARGYAVVEAGEGGRTLATLYLDLYPRADKFSHAAVWPIRGSSTAAGRLPTAALVTNVNRQGLTLQELETLLHEFGHALHVTLSNTRYASQAGTSVKLDFVEAPSQMLEEWVYDGRVLALFQQVCPSCEPVPAELLQRASASRSFAKGLQYARQHLYASYDLALYAQSAPEPLALWAQLEGATPLGHEAGSQFPAGFSHIAGGYSAGYYAYLWSKATAFDLHTAFAKDHLDAEVGRRYRDIVLANGSQIDANELVTRFLGRAPSNAAFFEWMNQ